MLNLANLNGNIFVTVTFKNAHRLDLPLWDKVMLSLQGDMSNLDNLAKELQEVKKMVNSDMNSKGFALRDVNIDIKFGLVKEK